MSSGHISVQTLRAKEKILQQDMSYSFRAGVTGVGILCSSGSMDQTAFALGGDAP